MSSKDWGHDDAANSIPLWVAGLVSKPITADSINQLYKNSSIINSGQNKVGVFPTTGGWVIRTAGTGQRLGRIYEEILYASSNLHLNPQSNSASIPLLTPGASWNGTASPIPTRSDAVYDAVKYPVDPGTRVRGELIDTYEFTTIANETYITVQAVGAGPTVKVSCEGNSVDAPFTQNPVNGLWGYVFKIASTPTQNGWAMIVADMLPAYGGMAGQAYVQLHLNSSPAGANYVPTVDKYIDLNGSDSNDGSSWQNAYRTLKKAMNSVPITGSLSSKNAIWRFNMGPTPGGTYHVWDADMGRPGGVTRTFVYQHQFIGQGKNITTVRPDAVALGYSWYAGMGNTKSTIFGGEGRNPKFQNMTIDFNDILDKTGGCWIDNCYLTDNYGPNREKYMGYRRNLYDNFTNGRTIGSTCRWVDNPVGNTNLFARFAISNSEVDLVECGTVQQKWNVTERISYDAWFVNYSGNWAHQNVVSLQYNQIEGSVHSTDYITVESVTPDANTNSTTVTFAAGPDWKTNYAVDSGRTYLRVLDSTDKTIKAQQKQYFMNVDGTRDYDYAGFNVKSWNLVSRSIVIDGTPNITIGDKMHAYIVGHCDIGQFGMLNNVAQTSARENYTRVNCRWSAHSWQSFLFQPGWVPASGTGVASSGPVDITGVTMTAANNSTTVTFDSGSIPGFLQKWDYIGYNTGTNTSLRLVTDINSANGTITIDKPFATAITNKPARAKRSIMGYYDVGTIGHKSNDDYEIGQIESGVVDLGWFYCTFPNWSGADACVALRTGVSPDGFTGVRWNGCLLYRLSTGGPFEPWPSSGVYVENCWLETDNQQNPLPNRILVGTNNSLAASKIWGYPDRTSPWSMNYYPNATMNILIPNGASIFWPQRKPNQKIGARG